MSIQKLELLPTEFWPIYIQLHGTQYKSCIYNLQSFQKISMSSSSCTSTENYLQYTSCECRKCGRSTFIQISASITNPGRLYYMCEVHGFSHWCVPTNWLCAQHENEDVTRHQLNGHALRSSHNVCYHVTIPTLIFFKYNNSCSTCFGLERDQKKIMQFLEIKLECFSCVTHYFIF